MNPHQFLGVLCGFLVALQPLYSSGAAAARQPVSDSSNSLALEQVPAWSDDDLAFFLHGSMSTELVPETVFRALIAAYPEIYSSADLSQFGLIPDPQFGWPIGFSRSKVGHLAGLPSVGINCASCHVGEVSAPGGNQRVRILGVTSHFDAEAFFGALLGCTFRTADPSNMKRFLGAYLQACDPDAGPFAQERFFRAWKEQEAGITAAMNADPSGTKQLPSSGLHLLKSDDLRLTDGDLVRGANLPALSVSVLQLFHNIRAALHVPDEPPKSLPPASGPGRNDAFGLLSAVLFGAPQPYAPVKYGLVWNIDHRRWVHWDGNTQSPLGRNLLASLGLGAPLIGKHGDLDFQLVKHQTDLSEAIRAPRYPFGIDRAAASRGSRHYQSQCASCHNGPETEARLYPVSQIGTEPHRSELFTQLQADRFNQFLSDLETAGYKPGQEPGIRSTGKLWAATLDGVWARSPYLHNGSVRTMRELLTPPENRSKSFRRGSRVYDQSDLGYVDEGSYVLDTTAPGNSGMGHNYGAELSEPEKAELLEYLKTL